MKSIRRAATIGIAAATVLGGTLALAPSASAGDTAMAQVRPAASTVKGAAPAVGARLTGTKAPYSGQCGSGYKIVNSAEIGAVGTVYLTYNSATGNNCVVTIRNTPGAPVAMTAELTITDTGERVSDRGNYTSYAGPVRLHAAGHCVNWYGAIGGDSNGKIGTNCGRLAN